MFTEFLKVIVYSITILLIGAFLQARFNILGIGCYSPLTTIPDMHYQKTANEPRKVFSITIEGKKYNCYGRFGSSDINCLPTEKSA